MQQFRRRLHNVVLAIDGHRYQTTQAWNASNAYISYKDEVDPGAVDDSLADGMTPPSL